MSFNASLLVMMGIFWMTYLILRIFFFKPMMELLEKRRETVESAQALYDDALAEAERQIEAERARLAEARATALARREKERREAQTQRQEQLSTAKSQAQETLAGAAAELQERVGQERTRLEERARQIADQMASQLLGRPA